jgi:hypothetical protein
MPRFAIIGTVKTCTNALHRAFENNSAIEEAHYQPIKTGLRNTGKPDYSIFDHDKTVFFKETIGTVSANESTMTIFPTDAARKSTFTLYIFRNPLDVYKSIKKAYLARGGNSYPNMAKFLLAYTNVFNDMLRSKISNPATLVATVDKLHKNPTAFLKALTAKWRLPYDAAMVRWKHAFLKAPNTVVSHETIQRMETDPLFIEAVKTIKNSSQFQSAKGLHPSCDILTKDEKKTIEAKAMGMYKMAEAIAKQDFPD